jgi:hypothetical protein
VGTIYPETPGTVVLNHGDPTFARARTPSQEQVLAREIFLRIIAYAPFAEVIAIPSRYILDGVAMYQAVLWAAPLLEAGVIQPERRSDTASFRELAEQRRLDHDGVARAQVLDELTKAARLVRWKPLEALWRDIICTDIDHGGAFRKLLSQEGFGVLRGRNATALDAVTKTYRESEHGLEDFLRIVDAQCAPEIRRLARRWAMARYYYTPTLVDATSVREIPTRAGQLLLRAAGLPGLSTPLDMPGPAELAFRRLEVRLDLVGPIETHASAYCHAALQVRRDIPRARRVFAERTDNETVRRSGLTVGDALQQECRRQARRPTRAKTRAVELTAILAATGVSTAAGMVDVPIGAAASVVAALGIHAARMQAAKRRRSWEIAVDRLLDYSSP